MIKKYYVNRTPFAGQNFELPSMTVPDLAYSLEQLVQDYSIGQLPSLSQLQDYLDDEDLVDSADNDLRFADKADMFQQFLESNKLRRSIFDNVKKQHEFRRKKEQEELASLRKRVAEVEKSSED